MYTKPTSALSAVWVYKWKSRPAEANLPGTGDTVIKQAVPSGGDCGLALRPVEACDFPKRGKLGCVIFGRGGLRSRIPRRKKNKKQLSKLETTRYTFPSASYVCL